jgi:hypothetical protein
MVNGSNRTYHSPNEYINKNYTSMGDWNIEMLSKLNINKFVEWDSESDNSDLTKTEETTNQRDHAQEDDRYISKQIAEITKKSFNGESSSSQLKREVEEITEYLPEEDKKDSITNDTDNKKRKR